MVRAVIEEAVPSWQKYCHSKSGVLHSKIGLEILRLTGGGSSEKATNSSNVDSGNSRTLDGNSP